MLDRNEIVWYLKQCNETLLENKMEKRMKFQKKTKRLVTIMQP